MSILVFVLLGSFILPHTGDVRGWDVLFGSHGAGAAAVALPSRVFAWLALVFGVGFSMLALVTRRWALAWVALAGSAIAGAAGMLAIWSRQTVAAGAPGAGVGPDRRLDHRATAHLPLGARGVAAHHRAARRRGAAPPRRLPAAVDLVAGRPGPPA